MGAPDCKGHEAPWEEGERSLLTGGRESFLGRREKTSLGGGRETGFIEEGRLWRSNREATSSTCCPYHLGLLGISTHTSGKVLQLAPNLWEKVPVLRTLRAEGQGWWIPVRVSRKIYIAQLPLSQSLGLLSRDVLRSIIQFTPAPKSQSPRMGWFLHFGMPAEGPPFFHLTQ